MSEPSLNRGARRVRRLTASLWLSDLLVITASVLGAQFVRIGDDMWRSGTGFGPNVSYTAISVTLVLVWMLNLQISGSRNFHVLGYGPEEFSKVLTGSMWTLALLAIASFSFRLGIARGFVAIAIPLGTMLLLLSRWLVRTRITRRRSSGRLSTSLLAIGPPDEVTALEDHLATHSRAGLRVKASIASRPERHEIDQIIDLAAQHDVDSVLLTAGSGLDQNDVRTLMWGLADGGRGLMLASALTGISGPRGQSRPVEGLPIWQVEAAHYSGGMWVVKEVFDRVTSAAAIIVLSPLLLAVALAIKLDSSGPIFFKQRRVGAGGKDFLIWKFRSMKVNADAELAELLAAQGGSDRPLFKPENDPRITRLGHFIRKYSIDELPQLFNVFLGSMSIVGPRPQVPAEVELYDHVAYRRLKTKPGITGLWQVSGRSDLDWDDAVLLDLHYVENWSFALDLALIWRTVGVVLTGRGAR